MAANTKFMRLNGDNVDKYDVLIIDGHIPPDIRERDTGSMLVQSSTPPKRFDIIIDTNEKLVIVWRNAYEMRGAYLVEYAAWPLDWKQYIPR